MPQKPPDLLSIVRALAAEGVEFIVIGGFAMVLHGGTNVTLDCDLAIAGDSRNASAIVRALAPLNPIPTHLPDSVPFVWDERSIRGLVVSLRTLAGDLDLFLFTPGVDSFEGMLVRSVVKTIAGIGVKVCSLEDLIRMKEEANRPKDLIHLEELIKIRTLGSAE